MIKHIIWDAGGTLFDTYPAMIHAMMQALDAIKAVADVHEIEGLLRISRRHAFGVLSQRYSLDADALEAAYRAAYIKIDPALQPVFPGVCDVIHFNINAGGSNFIVTHRSREGVLRLLDAHGLDGLFAAIITSDDDFPRKPDPGSLLHVLIGYALDPAKVLVVGDRAIDIQAGEAAGICTCLFSPKQRDPVIGFTVTHYDDLLHHLAQGTIPC